MRAAGAILAAREILVIGSQAIHASMEGGLPDEVTRSAEVDVAVPGDVDGSKADLIDGSIGEASMFHSTFGYYAQGVVETTARLPTGWRERLIRYETPATNGVVALCLEPHDLWISKAIAGRPKDREFCRALLAAEVVEAERLRSRLAAVEGVDEEVRAAVAAAIPGGP